MVARFYPPWTGGGIVRTVGFARHLPAFGYEPVILTGGCGEAAAPGAGGAEVIRAGGGGPRGAAGRSGAEARRPARVAALARASAWLLVPDAHASWRGPAVRAGLERLRRGDIAAIYSTSPPDTDHSVALELKRASGLPWVADFRDPWIGLAFRDPPTPWHRRAHREMLRAVLAGADRVVAATEGTRGWLARAAPGAGAPAAVIPNGFEEEEWEGIEPRRFERFTIMHAGRLSEDRTLAPFLCGLEIFLSRDPARRPAVECLMPGPHDAAEERLVSERGLGDVARFPGNLEHRQVLEFEAGASLLLLIKHGSPRFRDLIPGKLYEYLGVRRPVLAVVPEGPAAELVRGLRLGWVAPPDRPERIADALEEAFAGSHSFPAAAAEERAQFTRRALTGRLAQVLDEATR